MRQLLRLLIPDRSAAKNEWGRDHAHHHVATLTIGSLAVLVLGIEPVLLGAMVTEQRIAEQAVGALVTTELLAIAMGSVLGMRALGRFSARSVALLAGLALAGVDCAAIGRTGAPVLIVQRALAGLLEGMLMALALVAVARAVLPEHASGMFLAAQTLLQLVVVLFLPALTLAGSRVDMSLAILAGRGSLSKASWPASTRNNSRSLPGCKARPTIPSALWCGVASSEKHPQTIVFLRRPKLPCQCCSFPFAFSPSSTSRPRPPQSAPTGYAQRLSRNLLIEFVGGEPGCTAA
jgi:hypothetical protein